jgi:hypothetical protein
VLKVWQHQLTTKGKPWLVELPKNRRRTEVPATLQWQHWCSAGTLKTRTNRMLVGAALFYVSVTMFVALNSIASHGAEIPTPRYEPSYQRELNWGPDRRGPRYDSSGSCEMKWGPRVCARHRR